MCFGVWNSAQHQMHYYRLIHPRLKHGSMTCYLMILLDNMIRKRTWQKQSVLRKTAWEDEIWSWKCKSKVLLQWEEWEYSWGDPFQHLMRLPELKVKIETMSIYQVDELRREGWPKIRNMKSFILFTKLDMHFSTLTKDKMESQMPIKDPKRGGVQP